jgi:uncharacterized membrane protein
MSDQTTKGVPAVGFLVMAFRDEKAGEQALEAMKKGKKEKTFYFEEAAVIRQGKDGRCIIRRPAISKPAKVPG